MTKLVHALVHLVIGSANVALVAHYTAGNGWSAAVAAGGTYLVGALVALYNHGS
jgi:hypothetical protein